MALQSLLVPIITQFKSAGITQAKAAVGGLGRTFDSLAKNIGAAAGSFAAFQGLAGSRQFILDSIDATQKLERNLIALRQVYGNLSPSLEAFTKEVQSYGISQNQAAQASIFIGSVLKQYGFNVGEAASATQRIVKLSQDLATTYGYDVQEALLAVTALFRGEFDPIEKFGVAMKQNEINAELAARGLDDLEGAARENAEAQITLDFLFQRAADSVGAFARATDTLYASQKRLQAVTANLSAAFGEPFQKPLAEINNAFAKLIEQNAPGIQEISVKIGEALEAATPIVLKMAEGFLKLVQLTQPLIELLTSVVDILRPLLLPAFSALNRVIEFAVQFFDLLSAKVTYVVNEIRSFAQRVSEANLVLNPLARLLQAGAMAVDFFGSVIDKAFDNMVKMEQEFNALNGDIAGFDAGIKSASVALRGQALATRDAKNAAAEAAAQTEYFKETLRAAADTTEDAEGNLTGLAKIFYDVDQAAAKSKAKNALEELGLAAGLIEEVLAQPDWEGIFNRIRRLAYLTSIDIRRVMSVTALGQIFGEIDQIQQELNDLFAGNIGGDADNSIADFFQRIDDAVAKESARRRLSTMGASEGLIEAILGSAGWETVFNRVIRDGVAGLQELQAEFNKTAEGISELADATAELEQAQKDALDAARNLADSMQAIIDILGGLRLEDDLGQFESEVVNVFDAFNSQIESLYRNELISLENANRLKEWSKAYQDILVTIAQQRDKIAEQIKDTEEKLKASAQIRLSDADVKRLVEPLAVVGQSVNAYEQQVTESIDFIRTKLKEGLEKGVLTPGVVTELESLTKATSIALRSIAADRKALSDQYDELIRKQNDARLFKAATKEAILNYADVTNILKTASDRLSKAAKDATDKTTEIISQTIESSRNFRDYRVVLIREFLEPTAAATAKASDIADGLRKVLEDTRVFADNLRRLKELGLDPRLFKQIVDAGLEAGNSTAEAIIEGGPQTVREINELYSEIEKVGAQAANLASQELFDGGEEMIQGVIDGLISKDADLAAEASAISQKLVDAFQANIDTYEVNLTNLLNNLKSKEQAFKDAAKTLGSAFANTLTTYVNNALSGMEVPAFEVPEVELPPEVEEIFGDESDGAVGGEDEAPVVDPFARFGTGVATAIQDIGQSVGILIDSSADVAKVIAYLTERIGRALEYADNIRETNAAAAMSAEQTASDFWRAADALKASGFTGGPTVININVKTDSTQSQAMVGKTIGNVVTKYVQQGGGILVSPVG